MVLYGPQLTDDNDSDEIEIEVADDEPNDPVMLMRASFHEVVRNRVQSVFINQNEDEDQYPKPPPPAANLSDDNDDLENDLGKLMAAKLHQLQMEIVDENAGNEAMPDLSKLSQVPADDDDDDEPDLTADSMLGHLLLVIDVGTFATKVGVAVADSRSAWEVSDAAFLRVCTTPTRDLFADRNVSGRLARVVFAELLPMTKNTEPERLREFAHVLLAFPGFYFHRHAEMRFAPVFRAWSPSWNMRFTATTLAEVLGVNELRLSFMNSRTASGWAFTERFGCGERLGLVVTMGANTGLFGVWRGLMCFTPPTKRADRPVRVNSATVLAGNSAFDAGSVHLRDGRSVREALRFDPTVAPLAPDVLVECIEAAGNRLLELSAGTAAALHVAPPTSIVVLLAGGGASQLPADFVHALEQRVSRAWKERGISAQLEVAANAAWNDLRGALYFARLVAPRGSGSAARRLQAFIDQPSELFVEQQLFRHDVVTELVAYCANWAHTHRADAAAMSTACKWLLSRRRATLMTAVDSERAHTALEQLLRAEPFVAASTALDNRADSVLQSALLYLDLGEENTLALPDALRHSMCAWIAAHWRELALALVGARAVDALMLLTDVLINTPPPPPPTAAHKSLLSKLKHSVFAKSAASVVAPTTAPAVRVAAPQSVREVAPPIAGIRFDGRRPKPSRRSAQLITLFGGVEKRQR